jgi:hypothetical protein
LKYSNSIEVNHFVYNNIKYKTHGQTCHLYEQN